MNLAWVKALYSSIERKIQEHEETYDPSQTRDFIDLYIKHKEENHGTVSGGYYLLDNGFYRSSH